MKFAERFAFVSIARTVVSFFCVAALAPSLAISAPAVDLHNLNWYVHVDLIDVGAGEDLAFWQGVIDATVASGNGLLEGGQGPVDQPCCTRLGRIVAVTTFGSPGDGLDVIDSLADQNALSAAGGSGSNAFLVDSMTYCGGASPGAIGCAVRPGCDGNGNDNPNLWMAVTVDSFDSGTLPTVVAHERGHNSCLEHVATAECQIMQAAVFTPGLGGCMTASECTNYQAARTTTSSGLECSCYDNSNAFEPNGTACVEVASGVCSGGLCGASTGDAGVSLFVAAAPGTAAGGPPDDGLVLSALKGEWSTLAQFSPTADDVRGLAYATDSGILYGVVPTVGDDSIVTVDRVTGLISSPIGTIANGALEIVSMAYDPGATSAASDDRLLVLEAGGALGGIFEIDPASPSTANLLGTLVWGSTNLFTGLAYDSINETLYAATPFGPDGLYAIDLTTCPPSPCISNQVPGAGMFRTDASLSYSPVSGMLYLVGTAFGGDRTFYSVFNPATGTSLETLSLDVFTPAAMASVPEPGTGMALAVGVLALLAAARRRAPAI